MATVAYGEITILDLIDTATYIYYSANSDGSEATSSPQPNTKYIGIYSGKPITGGRPSVAPSGTTWTKYVGDDGAQGPQGAQGEQGYSFVASVSRPNFSEEQWQTYGTIGRSEWWTDTSNIRNGCRIGDIFTVVGTATDTRNSHIIYFKSLSNSGDLYGTCISHAIAERGAPGQNGTNGTNGKDGKDGKDGQDGQMFYATCSTEASAEIKVANLSGTSVFRLETGASVTVNFINQNTASNPKLEIKAGTSSYGAKDIWVNGKSMTNDIYYWEKRDSLVFVYDGQHWILTNASATIKANSFAVDLRKDLEEQISDIEGTANAASQVANTANGAAQSASQVAGAANQAAQNASSAAQTANKLADTANQTAKDAKTAADQANGAASTAKDTADKAKTAADEAAKTATNYLYFDTNGLQVGYKNSSGGWAGNRTQMTSNSFNILDVSGNALASYGSEILLGKSSGYQTKIDTSGLKFLDGSNNELASYNATKIILGKTSAFRTEIDNNGLKIYTGSKQLASYGSEILLGKSGEYQTKISNEGFNILDTAGNISSSFTSSKIELGKTGNGATIDFNNGFLSLYTETTKGYNNLDYSRSKLSSQYFSIESGQQFKLTSEYTNLNGYSGKNTIETEDPNTFQFLYGAGPGLLLESTQNITANGIGTRILLDSNSITIKNFNPSNPEEFHSGIYVRSGTTLKGGISVLGDAHFLDTGYAKNFCIEKIYFPSPALVTLPPDGVYIRETTGLHYDPDLNFYSKMQFGPLLLEYSLGVTEDGDDDNFRISFV